MTLKLDTLAYTNQLRRLPPEHKIIFAFTTLIISLCSHPLVQILMVLWMTVWIVIYARIPAGVYLRLLMFTIVFCLTSLPALMVNGVAITNLQIFWNNLIEKILHSLIESSMINFISFVCCMSKKL